jgi:hypothetical protein
MSSCTNLPMAYSYSVNESKDRFSICRSRKGELDV